jgi:hypothetical protein
VQNTVGVMSSFRLTYKPTVDQPSTTFKSEKPAKGRTNRLRLEPYDFLINLSIYSKVNSYVN